MSFQTQDVLVGLGMVGSAIAAFFGYIMHSRAQRGKDREEFLTKFAEQDKQLSLINIRFEPIWQMLINKLPDLVKRPTHLEMDKRLAKIKTRTASVQELKELKPMLKEIYEEHKKGDLGEASNDALMIATVEALLSSYEVFGKIKW